MSFHGLVMHDEELGLRYWKALTYPDDGDCFDVILKPLRLLAGVFLSHGVDGKTVEGIWEMYCCKPRVGLCWAGKERHKVWDLCQE